MEKTTQTKMYDPNALSERPMPEAGDKIKAEVTDIKPGKLGELISADVLAKWDNADPEAPAIEIVAQCEDGSIRRRTIQVPVDDRVHPSSNLAKWKNAYGAYPSVGQRVYLLADAKGFYQFQV